MDKRLAGGMLCLLLLLGSIGCNYKQFVQSSDADYGSKHGTDPKMLGSKMYGSATGNPHQHDNHFFEYSSMLSRQVTALNGVASATVMLTDKNAYVGIMLDWTSVGTRKTGGADTKEQDNGGMEEGVYNNTTGSPYWDNRKLVTPYNSYFSVNDHNQLSSELKQTIAVRIRKLAPMVQEVHISANMDFVNEMTEFAKEAWLGHSLTPWVDDFNTLVKYQFDGGVEMPVPLQIRQQQLHDQEIIRTE